MLDFLATTSVLSWSSRTWWRWRTRVIFLWYWCGWGRWWHKWQNHVSCQRYQVRKYRAPVSLPFSSQKLIFSILANNSLFCFAFHLSVIIKMHELDCSWLTFTWWTFKTASPPRTKLKLKQDMETNDNANTEAIPTVCHLAAPYLPLRWRDGLREGGRSRATIS